MNTNYIPHRPRRNCVLSYVCMYVQGLKYDEKNYSQLCSELRITF